MRATSAPATTLRRLVEEARTVRHLLGNLHSRYNRKVVEQAAIAGVLNPAIFGDPAERAAGRRLYRAGRL